MLDYDYWKNAYKTTWEKSGQRENAIAELIEEHTGKKVERAGFGVGSDKFLSGNAKSYGHEKGEADLEVKGTNIRLEVTGPLVQTVSYTHPLWVRPDKIESARSHLKDHDTWVVHCLEKDGTVRVIRLDEGFFNSYDSNKYETVHPHIRGREETYIAIPYDDDLVQNLEVLIEAIKSR